MNFFNPSLWFVCRYCRQVFPNTDKLKEHKLENHLGNCLEIKCIVFEERCIDNDWIPPEVELFSNSSTKLKGFVNPFVSLARLTPQELHSRLNVNTQNSRRTRNQRKIKETQRTTSCATVTEKCINRISICQNNVVEVNQLKCEEVFKQNFLPKQGIQICSDEFFALLEPKQELGNRTELAPISNFEPKSGFHLGLNNAFDQGSAVNSTFNIPVSGIPAAAKTQELVLKTEPEEINNQEIPQIVNFDVSDSTEPSVNFNEENVIIQNSVKNLEPSTSGMISPISHDATKPFMCPTCFRFYKERSKLRHHMKTHHSDDLPFKCSHCIAAFRLERNLKRHLVSHGKDTSWKCRLCDKFCYSKVLLSDHERTHTGERPFKCQVANCKWAFTSARFLKAHTHSQHFEELGLPQFVCRFCGKSYGIRTMLNRHMKDHHHLDYEPFKCSNCTAAFRLERNLKRHLASHGKNTSWKCRVCDKFCYSKVLLSDHERTHTGERPFKCQVANCKWAFTSARFLKAHTHSQHFEELGLPQFVCRFCGKSYGIRTMLNRHMKVHHNTLTR